MKAVWHFATLALLTLTVFATPASDLGLPGFRHHDGVLQDFSWPGKVPNAKFVRMLRFTALGVNVFELAPTLTGAAVQWPDGHTIKVSLDGETWLVEHGVMPELQTATTLPSGKLTVAIDGTGVVFRQTDGSLKRVEGGFESGDISLWLPAEAEVPPVKSIYLADDALLWCYADEAEQVLERAARQYTEQLPFVRAAWGSNSQERSWNTKLDFYRRALSQVKQEAVAATDGFLPALVTDPILRDRYSWLIWMSSKDFAEESGYFGGIFRKNWFRKLGGRGEIYSALLFADKLDKLVSRSRRVTGAAFQEGVAWEKRLGAGFVSALELVPKLAGLPCGRKSSASLRCARGEAESIQLVLTTGSQDVDKVSLQIAAETAGAPAISLERVEYLCLTETANPQLPLSRGGDVAEPDVCLPLDQGESFNIASHCQQPVLLTVHCAGDTQPGEYKYTVSVMVDCQERLQLSLSVKVENFALGRRFPNMAGFRAGAVNSWYGSDNAKEARRNLMKTMMQYRLEPLDLYVFSPGTEDIDWALENGLESACLGQFSGLASPEPGMVKFVELYGSVDGKTFEPVPAEVQLVPRDNDNPLGDEDLLITPKASLQKYRICKVHNRETRGWYDRVSYSFFYLYPSQGTAVEVNGNTPIKDIAVIQPDNNVTANGLEQAKKVTVIKFDNLVNGQNLASVLWTKGEEEINSIRLINRCVETTYQGLKKHYDELRQKAGQDFTLYMYSFDEIGAHLNGRMLSALKKAKLAFPDVKTVSTAANLTAMPEIYDYLDIHCPANAYALPRFEANVANTRQAKFWTYVGGGGYYPFANFERVDQPRIYSRAFFWEAIAFDHIQGFLYWHIHYWRNNTALSRLEDLDWTLWNPTHGDNNGMSAIFYPGRNNQVYPSLRASAMRDGIEDTELFLLAQARVQNEEDQAELEAIRHGFSRSMSVFCKDIAEMEMLRNRLLDLLEKVSRP